MERPNSCVSCNRSVLRRRKHLLTQIFLEQHRDHAVLLLQEIMPREIPFDGTRSICHACWMRYGRLLRDQPIQDQPIQDLPIQDEPTQDLPIQDQPPQQVRQEDEEAEVVGFGNPFIAVNGYWRASNTRRRCVFQNCRNATAHNVPTYAKFKLLHNNNFYIPEAARVCNPHLGENNWEDLLNGPRVHENFNGAHVLDMMNIMKWGYEHKGLDFENIQQIDDNEFHFWTGVTKIQFNVMLNETSSLRNTTVPATTLGIYLTKIRTGEPDNRLATKFNMSRRTFVRNLNKARQCLTDDFVPRHVGFNHITREDVVARNLSIPSHCFGGNQNEDAAILVCDGTYSYLQKSANFLFQRKTYSLHKFRNLVKPFLIVCTDGYTVDVDGPFTATTSDATIMNHLMQEDSPVHIFLRPGDVFILDRGFRDSIDTVEECGYRPYLPPTRGRGEQLTTVDANKSRLITMCRWVVEAINGRFKKDFKIFRHTYFNVTVRNMMTDFKITAALINLTRYPYVDNLYADQFIDIINERMNEINELAAFEDFPQLTYEELMLFTLGSYHLRLAKSYCHEHMRLNGVYTIEMYRHPQLVDNKILLRGRIQSRHVRARQYYTYILVDPTQIGTERIKKYYCTCIRGRRTVGSCAHVASVVYFLAWARHQDVIDAPAAFLDNIIIDIDHAE